MDFKEENIREVVYIHEVKMGFEVKNIIRLTEDFEIDGVVFKDTYTKYSKYKIDGKENPDYNWSKSRDYEEKGEKVILPKGLTIRIDAMKSKSWKRAGYGGANDNYDIVVMPLLKYNKKLDEDYKELIRRKMTLSLHLMNGMKFALFLDDDAFMRKRKIDTLLETIK